jgi:hypothetical protein
MVTAPDSLIEEADWSFDDEDWIRDAVHALASYARWRLYDEDPFISMHPDMRPGPVLADDLAFSSAKLAPTLELAWPTPRDLLYRLEAALDDYCAARPPNAGGSFGFERWRGVPAPRDNPPAEGARSARRLAG